jgi:hypothetical protein
MSVFGTLLIVGFARTDAPDQPWTIHGQVVDEQGTPVEDFDAAMFWLANGNWWDEAGQLLPAAAAGKLWTNEGVLAPSPHSIATRLPEGRFSLTVDGYERATIFAVDKRRERGGVISVDQHAADKPVTITLVPLVRVTAKVHCSEAGRTPDWTNAVVYVPDDQGNRSFRGEVSFTSRAIVVGSPPSATILLARYCAWPCSSGTSCRKNCESCGR